MKRRQNHERVPSVTLGCKLQDHSNAVAGLWDAVCPEKSGLVRKTAREPRVFNRTSHFLLSTPPSSETPQGLSCMADKWEEVRQNLGKSKDQSQEDAGEMGGEKHIVGAIIVIFPRAGNYRDAPGGRDLALKHKSDVRS